MTDANATVATVLTPSGRGAVAVVAIHGPAATAAIDRCFVPAGGRSLESSPVDRIVFGRWRATDLSDQEGEEVVVTRRRDSYAEVHCHGGNAAVQAVTASLASQGVLLVASDAFAQSTDEDPWRKDAWRALSKARTRRTAAHLLDQHRGAFTEAMEELRGALVSGDETSARRMVDQLLANQRWGAALTAGFSVAICGAPNVGKSSLLNAILGYERAIVFDQPGTTRDVVSATAAFDGWPLHLYDTAGLRVATDLIEREGVQRAIGRAAQADLVLYVRSHDARSIHQELPAEIPVLEVWNKCDLAPSDERTEDRLHVSARTGEGLPTLLEQVVAMLLPNPPRPGDPAPITAEQVALLKSVEKFLDSGDVSDAAVLLRAAVEL